MFLKSHQLLFASVLLAQIDIFVRVVTVNAVSDSSRINNYLRKNDYSAISIDCTPNATLIHLAQAIGLGQVLIIGLGIGIGQGYIGSPIISLGLFLILKLRERVFQRWSRSSIMNDSSA